MIKTNPKISLKIANPVLKAKVTQYFGVPKTDYLARAYRSFGLICSDDKSDLYRKPFHNGIDFGTSSGQKCYCVYPAVVTKAVYGSKSAGNFVELTTDVINEKGLVYKLKFRYLHLKSISVKKNQRLTMGEVVGRCDNTGFSTGPHLHFDVMLYKETVAGNFARVNNGYLGFMNPQELFTDVNWNKLPVDKRYGRKRNYILEYTLRFAATPLGAKITPFLSKRIKDGQYIHKVLKKRGRTVPLMTNRESNAIIYGNWGPEIFNEAMFASYAWCRKEEVEQALKDQMPIGTPFHMGGENDDNK